MREFRQIECTVLEARIQTQTDDKVKRFRPEIRISFKHNDVPFVLWTYDSDTLTEKSGFSTEKANAEEIIEQFKPGEVYECWYNPQHPEKTVLVRKSSFWSWFFLAIPVLLMIFGVFGVGWSIRNRRVSEERKAAKVAANPASPLALITGIAPQTVFPTVPDPKIINESPGTYLAFRLPATWSSSVRMGILAAFTILWNVFSWSILVWSLYNTSGTRNDILFSILFGLFFCGFGMYFTIRTIHDLLTAFGIGPTILEISDHPIYPGRRYRLVYVQTGTLKFRSLNIDLVCEEVARFRQGTDTITSRKEVYTQPLLFIEDFETSSSEPFRQDLLIRLPLGAMHSVRLEHNEILWKIVLRAKLIGWPDLFNECPIIVYPAAVTERAIE